MLQLGIHCVITDLIVSMCKDISQERKRKWPDGVGPICDWHEWEAKGRPNPTGSISSSLLPEYNPIAILRVLNEFFQDPEMQDRLKMSITRQRTRNITVDYDPRQHAMDLHDMTSMELFNGSVPGLNGGVRNSDSRSVSFGQAIPYINSWDGSEWAHSSLDYISNYYKAWGCENDFVHPRNRTIGYCSQDYLDTRHHPLRSPHNMLMYSDVSFTNDNHPYFVDRDGTLRGFTKMEKRRIISQFLRELCEKYIIDEPGVSQFDRVTWYEVSEFIKFYYDSWQSIDHPDGDEEEWMAEGISSTPLSCYRYNSSMYNVPGVWSIDEGGKWSENFERIMKLGTNHRDDWYNSIWKKKYQTYIQRVFEEDGVEIYRRIVNDEETDPAEIEADEETDEVSEQPYEIINETPREQVKNLMELIFENKEDMKEGVFLELCNKLKEIHDIL